MLNAFIIWLTDNWDLIVELFMWSVSLLMVFILAAKIYKIIKFKFETADAAGLFFGAVWILLIIFFGFDHIREFLQSFL